MDFTFLRYAAIGGVQASLILIAGHYFPWQRLTGKQLPILCRYIYGIVSVCFIGFPIAIIHMPIITGWQAVAMLVIVSAFGGLAVFGCYGIDKIGQDNEVKDSFVNDNYKDAYNDLKNDN